MVSAIHQHKSAVGIHMSPPFQPPPHPTSLGCHRAPVWAPCVVQQIPSGYLFYIRHVCSNATHFVPPSPYPIVFPSFCCVYIAALQTDSSVPFFQILYKKYNVSLFLLHSVFSSVAQLYLILCDPMDCSMPGFPLHYQLPDVAQTHAHQVSDCIQPSHLLPSPSPPSCNLSQHQGLLHESVFLIR